MAKGFSLASNKKRLNTLLNGISGDWTLLSATESENYTYGHDERGLYLYRTNSISNDVTVTWQYNGDFDLTNISKIIITGTYGTDIPNNPPLQLIASVSAGATVTQNIINVGGGTTDAVPPRTFYGIVNTDYLTGPGTFSLIFKCGIFYANPSMIFVDKIILEPKLNNGSNDCVLFKDGATTDSGTWYGYKGYTSAPPTFGSTIVFPYISEYSFIGSLATCEYPIDLYGNAKLSIDMGAVNATIATENMAPGATWGNRIYALFSKQPINLPSDQIDTPTWAQSQDAWVIIENSYKQYHASDAASKTTSIAAGTKTVDVDLTGTYYFGIFFTGYNAVTNQFNVNNVIFS